MLIHYIKWASNHFSTPAVFMAQVFQGPGFSQSRFFKVQVFQGPGCSESMFFRVQVFLGPGFSESRFLRVRVQGPGPSFRSSPNLNVRMFNLSYFDC